MALWPANPLAQTVDVHGVATNAGIRSIRDTRLTRQTFQVGQGFTVTDIFLSVGSTYNPDIGFTIKLFEVSDIEASSWSEGTQVGNTITIAADSAGSAMSSSNLHIQLEPGEQFFLPARGDWDNSDTTGYGMELESVGTSSTNVFSWAHAYDGTDYAPGRYYGSENAFNINLDMGLALVPEPGAWLLLLSALACGLLVRRRK